ncbi:hypothetical protein CAEBREN_11611 [Caenorhabditis brenneri]|uniref:Uncharacterized protein n=1 Tax=Caenorhabditis brenneri TaxID=135651 RepID=G0N2L0_CAEBE|nr:hypothetical protein CAEBREN_11611 [Caenorhabditis brenneri]
MLQFRAFLVFLVLFGVPSTDTRIMVGSSVVFRLFGVEGHTQYSFALVNAVLKEVKLGASTNASGNAPSLEFVFENP